MSENYNVEKSIDYLSFTCPRFNVFEPDIENEGIQDEIHGGNVYGYNRKQVLNNGVVAMWHTENQSMGVHYIYSASAIRKQKTAITEILESAMFATNNKLSRIDICVTSERKDGKEHELKPHDLAKMARAGNVITKMGHGVQIGKNMQIETMYFGSLKGRKRLFRAYDKGLEQGLVPNFLVRYELETRAYAANIGKAILENQDIGALINKYVNVENETWKEIMSSEIGRVSHIENHELDPLLKKWDWLLTSCAPALGKAIAQTPPEKLEVIMRQFQSRVYSNYMVTKELLD